MSSRFKNRRVYSRTRPKRPGRFFWLMAGGLASLGMVAAAIYRHFLPPVTRMSSKRHYPWALLLGCSTHDDGSITHSQQGRCLLAMEQYDQGLYDTLMISGGAVRNSFVEADVMKNWIDQQRAQRHQSSLPIVCERQARNTWQNLANTKAITGDVPIVILTGSTHARRAAAMAAQFFSEVQVVSYPDFTWKKALQEIVSRFEYCRLELRKRRPAKKKEGSLHVN